MSAENIIEITKNIHCLFVKIKKEKSKLHAKLTSLSINKTKPRFFYVKNQIIKMNLLTSKIL